MIPPIPMEPSRKQLAARPRRGVRQSKNPRVSRVVARMNATPRVRAVVPARRASSEPLDDLSVDEREVDAPVERLYDLEHGEEMDGGLGIGT